MVAIHLPIQHSFGKVGCHTPAVSAGAVQAWLPYTSSDLLMQQGDRERATARYQSAWERLAPLLAQWDRSRAVMSGEHLRSLRQRLLPHVTQP